MSKLYNTQHDFSTSIRSFLQSSCKFLRKTQLNILPSILFGMINSESAVSSDIAKSYKDPDGFYTQFDSKVKRIRRFFNNKLFDPYLFYESFISYVIHNFKNKHLNKRVHITIDHMFCHDNYTVLMFSMRIGSQSIPLWFRCFDGNSDPNAYTESLIIQGVDFVSSLFKNSFDLIFLADRWFNSITLMHYIESLNHKYVFRLKHNIKAFAFNKKEGHNTWFWLDDFTTYEYHSVKYDVLLSEKKHPCSIVFSKRHGYSEPWILATNQDYKLALIDYSHRFGGIETLFKNQKSNGFNIEKVCNASLKAFSTMYSLICFCITFMTIIGCDYAKNTSCYRHINIETHKCYIINGKRIKKRVMSLFNTGLTLIKLAFYSCIYIRIPYNFILYDI